MTELPSVQVTGGKTLRVSRIDSGASKSESHDESAPGAVRERKRRAVQLRHVSGDRKTESRAARSAVSRALHPEIGFEHLLEQFFRNPEAPIGHRHDERFFFRGQPNLGRACIGAGVREKVFHTAFETQRSCRQNARLRIRFQCGIAFKGHGAPEVRVVVR